MIISLALAVWCVAYSWSSLRLNANLDDLISPNRPFMADYRKFLQEFGDLEYIIIAVDASQDRAAAERAVDRLLEKLHAIKGLPDIAGTIEPDEQLRIATRAMSDQELRDLALASGAFPALLAGDTARVINEADSALDKLILGGLTMPQEQQERTGAAAILLLKAIAASKADSATHDELKFLIAQPAREYLRSDTGRMLFINILPVKDYSTLSVIEEPLTKIRGAISEVRREFPAVPIGLTGKPVLQYDEMDTSNDDMTKASIIAFVLCAALLVLMLRGFRRPLLAVIAFAIGSAWTYGFATLTVGELNLLSIVFMLVLVGVGLDYGVHVIARYQEFRRKGETTRDALRNAILTAVRGNITGALTSSVVFFMACCTTFRGLRELGLIAGGGLILCLAAMTFVLPALLAIVERRRPPRVVERPTVIGDEDAIHADQVDAWFIRYARFVLLGAVIITAVFIFGLLRSGVRFEFNLLKLQAQGLESIDWEHRIMADSASASWFGAAVANDQQQALQFIDRAKQRPTIGAIHSVFDIVKPDSSQRDAWRAQLHSPPDSPGLARGSATTSAQSAPSRTQPSQPSQAALVQAGGRLQLIATGAAARAPEEAKRLSQLVTELKAIDLNEAAQRESITRTLASIAKSLQVMLEGDALPLRGALPSAVRAQFVSPDGHYLVMLHPKQDVWEYEPMKAFIADLRVVDPHVTGTPVTHFESIAEMLHAFFIMSMLALAAIIILLVIDFRSSLDVLLALIPLAFGMLWTVEAMALLGLSFNLANFFAVPMLIGLGVDAAVHILHRYHEGGDRLNMGNTRRAVILTSLTTIIGFGALVIAHHRGLYSLGVVMAIGSTACMLSSIMILPALLALRENRRANHRGGTETPRER